MEKAALDSTEIPTALPGFEDDSVREQLLLEEIPNGLEDVAEGEDVDLKKAPAKSQGRRWQVLRTLACFGVFLCVLVIGVAWFFGMGWFAEQKAHPISRSTSKEVQTPPVTEDEKLKMALSLIAAPATTSPSDPNRPQALEESVKSDESHDPRVDNATVPPAAGVDSGRTILASSPESYSFSLPSRKESPTGSKPLDSSRVVEAGNEAVSLSASKAPDSDDARSRSLFFGISGKPAREQEKSKSVETEVTTTTSPKIVVPTQIPFGTLLPVRLVGSIYTLRNSGGFVRMELTRPVEGNGYAYPAGTMIVGNVRSGESVRAFVSIVGLIDPVSGELVRLSGELLGRDGGSGIEGRRRNLTSRWARFFRGMKDTAASVLGSVGAFRSGGTVILSEPIRRRTESMTEDLSGALLKNEREDSFLEVAAGSNGYVLVTGLPENSAATTNKPIPEAAKE